MGIPIDGPSYIYCDNKSVVTNAQNPRSQLGKKNNSICYHYARESAAMGESLVTHINMNDNFVDLITKVLHSPKRHGSVAGLLYDIYDHHKVTRARPTTKALSNLEGTEKYLRW